MDTRVINEVHADMLAERAANIQRWLVALGLHAQLYHFNQEYIRVALRSKPSEPEEIAAMLQRWSNFLVPYMAQHAAPLCVTVEAVMPIIDVQVVG